MELRRDYTVIAADVKRAQEGDRAAMDRIIGDVQDSVYYTCLKILHDTDEAQDATQDVLCSIFVKLKSLRDPSAYIGWVNRVTANTCKLRMTRSGREVFLQPDEDGNDPFAFFEQTDDSAVPDKVIDNAETQNMIVELVNKLPDEQRMCVVLFYYDQMKTREIADALNISEGTVKSRLNYARKAIKEGVQEYEKQGIRLYGISPIPFIGYFLRKMAGSEKSPITPAIVRAAAAGESAAVGTASTTAAATAEVVAGGAKLAGGVSTGALLGRIGVGVAAAALFFGIGYGIYRSVEIPRRKDPGPVPSASPVAEATIAPEPTTVPESTPEPEETPESTPAPEETPEPVRNRLYGSTYCYGARFTVDQYGLDSDGTIRLSYENDTTSFALGRASSVIFELETTEDVYTTEETYSVQKIEAGSTGTLTPAFNNATGTPLSLTIRNIIPLDKIGSPQEVGREYAFRIALTGAPETEPAATAHITGEASWEGLTVAVDQTYTDNGMGKIILRLTNGTNQIRLGWTSPSQFTLETDQGTWYSKAKAELQPSGEDTLIVYFDNAKGTPQQITINELYRIGSTGLPENKSGSTIVIPLTVEEPGTENTPRPTAAAQQPVSTPKPTPTWSEWSTEEPPEDALDVHTRQMYHKRGIYWKNYYFSQYGGETAEETEAAVDAAIASDLAGLEAAEYKFQSSDQDFSGEEWRHWRKSVRVIGPYGDWQIWSGDNALLRSKDGLIYSIEYGYTLYSVDFQVGAEYQYLK